MDDETILYEFTIPIDQTDQIIIRIVQEELINVMELLQGEQKIRIKLLGYTPNFLAEMINLQAMKYSSLHNINPQFQPFIPNLQPPRPQSSFFQKSSYGPRSTAPATQSSDRPQRLSEISVQEAIDIINGKKPRPERTVRVKTNEQEMVDFIIAYKGGSELYIRGELKIFKSYNLFIDFKLFTETIARLVHEKVVGERHKNSRAGHHYIVYIIPKTIPIDSGVKKVETSQQETPEPSHVGTRPTPNTLGETRPVRKDKRPTEKEERSLPEVKLVPATDVKSTITEFLEQLFYSYQDDELTLDLFISEATYQKIPAEIARAFYLKKLEERDLKYAQKLNNQQQSQEG